MSPPVCGAHLYVEGTNGETVTIECEKARGHEGEHTATVPNNGEGQITWPEDERVDDAEAE